jgi:hypothetical protein
MSQKTNKKKHIYSSQISTTFGVQIINKKVLLTCKIRIKPNITLNVLSGNIMLFSVSNQQKNVMLFLSFLYQNAVIFSTKTKSTNKQNFSNILPSAILLSFFGYFVTIFQ